MNFKNRSHKNIFISLCVVFVFGLLMVFGLKHNPNFTPSQLIDKNAPVFQATLSNGEEFQFQNLINKHNWIVVNFWSSGCIVCREEARELQSFYSSISLLSPKNPQLVSINIEDDLFSIQNWQKDYSQTFPVVMDSKGLISVNYGVTGTPETFFIDPNGIVKYRVAGSINKNSILKIIEKLSM